MKFMPVKFFSNELFSKLSLDLVLRLVDVDDDEDVFVFDEFEWLEN